MATDGPAGRPLAHRLRTLREKRWPDVLVTQKQVAEALGGDRPLSAGLISSWESRLGTAAPPPKRLLAYATFFATRRSIESSPARVLDEAALTPAERSARDELYGELMRLRSPESHGSVASAKQALAAGCSVTLSPGDELGGGTWYFGESQRPVVLVCAKFPKRLIGDMPYLNPKDPDYVRAYTYADLDALIELHGHIRAVNPFAEVHIRTPDRLEADDYTSHIVLLGGIDWNLVTRDLIAQLNLPVRQHGRTQESEIGAFEAGGKRYVPVVDTSAGQLTLREDVAYFYRGVNPANRQRTVTLCNGMFARGTYGVVRALADRAFRNRNEEYLAERFGDTESFGLLSRVSITVTGETLTPDWTVATNRLYEWPEA